MRILLLQKTGMIYADDFVINAKKQEDLGTELVGMSALRP